jgi:N,N'-diacetylchitobiose phosphorylase
VEYELHYEEDSFQFFTMNETPDGFDCLRDAFIGPYRTETNPIGVETGPPVRQLRNDRQPLRRAAKASDLRTGRGNPLIFILGTGRCECGAGGPRKVHV